MLILLDGFCQVLKSSDNHQLKMIEKSGSKALGASRVVGS